MRNRRVRAEHQEAVSRRLAQLSEELSASRAAPAAQTASGSLAPHPFPQTPAAWWATAPEASGEPGSVEPRSVATPVPDHPPPVDRRSLERELLVAPQPWVPRSPGRHVSRRPAQPTMSGPLADLLPQTLRGRVRLGSGALTVIAVLVACAVVLTAWRVVRAAPEPPTMPVAAPASGDLVEVPEPGAGETATTGTTPPATSSAVSSVGDEVAADGSVTVDVAGKVRRPGIVVLPAGARVVDALEQAGGARPGVDTTALNLARPLVDGEQLLVGVEAPAVAPGVPAPSTPGSVAPAGGALVDLNLATQAELEELPEVGPVTAAAIIAWREQNGGFTSVDELLEVDGIGDATLAQLAPLVTV